MNSDFVPADPFGLGAFSTLIAGVFLLVMLGAKRIDRKPLGRTQLSVLAFLLLFSMAVTSGIPERHVVPAVPALFLANLSVAVYFSFSIYGKILAASVPLGVLVGFQCFRIPLEIILHHWSHLGTVPPTMTWTGQNYDVASGVLALGFAPFVSRRERLAWVPTVVGLILLLNVVRVVVMSSPFPFGRGVDPPLRLILFMPYALIVPLCVIPALVGHLLVLRLLSGRRRRP